MFLNILKSSLHSWVKPKLSTNESLHPNRYRKVAYFPFSSHEEEIILLHTENIGMIWQRLKGD